MLYLNMEDEIYCFTIGKNSNDNEIENAAFAYRIELRIKWTGWKMELVVVHRYQQLHDFISMLTRMYIE